MSKKAICVSAFNYTNRMKLVKEHLEKVGYDCIYITSDFNHIEKKKYHIENAIQIETKPYYKNLSIDRLYSHSCLAKDTFDYIEKEKPDFLFVMVPPNSMAKQAAKYKHNYPNTMLVLDLYDLWPESLPSNKMKNILVGPLSLWKNIRDNGLSSADLITTECKLFQEILRKQLVGKKSRILYPCGTKTITTELLVAPSSEELNLCYLGSINNIIDIETITALLNEIIKNKPIVLHIIGDGESRNTFIDKMKSIGVKTKFYGKVYDNNQKQQIFNKCSFGLNIMKDSVCVGLTLKSIDYFAGGLPILNTIIGDTYELVEQRKLGVNINREHLQDTAITITKISSNENLQLRKNSLSTFDDLFSEDAFKKNLDFIK